MTDEKETFTVEEVRKLLDQEKMKNFGKMWFMAALSHTMQLTNAKVLPAEAHNFGIVFFEQFLANTGQTTPPVQQPPEPKPEDQ